MSSHDLPKTVAERYRTLQRYVQWSEEDARRVQSLLPLVEPEFSSVIDDFYETIEQHPAAAHVITGGSKQVQRLKGTLREWLRDLFTGPYNSNYAARRWRVGWRHVEIGLESVFASVALSRVRSRLAGAISRGWRGDPTKLALALQSFHKLLDLDLAIIQDAYESEFVTRRSRSVRERSEAAFRRLVEAAGSVIVILREDGTIAYLNPFAEQLTGFAHEAVLGKAYAEVFLRARDRRQVTSTLDAVWQGKSQRGLEHSILCQNGATRRLLWDAQRLEDFHGAPAILVIGQDVTEQKRAEERALQSERLAAIGETVAGLAHESRNAFQRSQACLELLALELEGQTEKLELVERVQRALDHLHRLYEEVREYAAPITLDRQLCDLAHLWRDAWAQLEADRAEKSMRLVEIRANEKCECRCDWFAMGQVFRNVLENAIVAAPPKSRVELACRSLELEGQPAVEISIKDQGPGVPDDIRPHVFDAFFTTRTKGSGLGMAIARRIVEAHRGQISVGDSTAGAEFVILIPRE